MTAKRMVEVCPAAIKDLQTLLPRRMSRVALLRLVTKLEYWKSGDAFALDARVVPFHEDSLYELLIDEAFGFTAGLRIAFCEDRTLSCDGKIWLLGMRREDEPATDAMVKVLRFRREMTTN